MCIFICTQYVSLPWLSALGFSMCIFLARTKNHLTQSLPSFKATMFNFPALFNSRSTTVHKNTFWAVLGAFSSPFLLLENCARCTSYPIVLALGLWQHKFKLALSVLWDLDVETTQYVVSSLHNLCLDLESLKAIPLTFSSQAARIALQICLTSGHFKITCKCATPSEFQDELQIQVADRAFKRFIFFFFGGLCTLQAKYSFLCYFPLCIIHKQICWCCDFRLTVSFPGELSDQSNRT